MNPLIEVPGIADVPEVDGPPETGHTSFVLPPQLTWETLRQPVDYSDNLLGNRFLERGQGLILYGPAGCGKSVAGLQAVVEWAAGLNGLHIAPAAPLKTVLLQTEDSLNDVRESLAGILASSLFTSEEIALVEQNLIILPHVPGGDGTHLARMIKASAINYKPDLIHVNPILAFCPGDPTRDLGALLYQFVDPAIKLHRVGFFGVHHTPKTNYRDTSAYGAHDHQYLAAGDARVANWPRAMIQIEPVASRLYRFRASKRGQRIGWTWNGQPTNERYFRQAEDKIRWIDASPEDASQAAAVENYRRIIDVLPAADKPGISRERVRDSAKRRLHVGKNKADEWLKLAIEDGTAERVENPTPTTNRKEALFRQKAPANAE